MATMGGHTAPIVAPGLHNGLHKNTELIEAVRRQFGETGAWGLERIGETLTPIFDPWLLAETRFLRGELTQSRAVAVTAGAAGTFAGVALLNRTAFGRRIFVVEEVSVFVPATSQFRCGTTTEATSDANFNNQLGAKSLDTRQNDLPLRIGFGIPAGVVTSDHMIGVALASTLQYINELKGTVLTPGFAVFVQTQDDAANFNVNFKWRERQALPGELP